MNDTVKDWLNRVIGSFIQGGSHAASAFISTAIAAAIGVPMPVLHWSQVGVIFLVSGSLNLFKVLEKVPLPGFKTGDTVFTTKPPTP